MLGEKEVWATMPTADVGKAAEFYTNIGLKILEKDDYGVALEAGNNSHIYLYMKGKASGDDTSISFDVDDIEAEVRELRSLGVEFEDYDIPEMDLKTEDGIATMGKTKAAWFKDPDGNIIAVTQMEK